MAARHRVRRCDGGEREGVFVSFLWRPLLDRWRKGGMPRLWRVGGVNRFAAVASGAIAFLQATG